MRNVHYGSVGEIVAPTYAAVPNAVLLMESDTSAEGFVLFGILLTFLYPYPLSCPRNQEVSET